MIDSNLPVTEEELHAYVDGELPADRKEAVADWLAAHPEQAATVAIWRAQAEAITARYAAAAEEPVPARSKPDQIMRHSGTSRRCMAAFWRTGPSPNTCGPLPSTALRRSIW